MQRFYDHARPDAPAPRLAQMEPRPRGARVRPVSTSPISSTPTRTWGRRRSTSLADVEGREITAGEFRRVYQQQIAGYRRAYGANLNDQLLRQLGIDQRILQQMIDQQASLAEAKRLGITASDGEVRAAPPRAPGFQDERASSSATSGIDSCFACSGRRCRPDEFEARSCATSLVVDEAPCCADRMDDRRRRGRRRGVPAPQREGEARGRHAAPPTSSARASRSTDAEVVGALRQEQGAVPRRREAQGQVPAGRRAGAARSASPSRQQRDRDALQRQHRSSTRRPSRSAPATSC